MQRETSTAAVVSLIFGILAWTILPLLGSLTAIIAGHIALADIHRDPALEGRGLALAGAILGWIQIALIALAIIGMILLLIAGISLSVLFQ